MRRSERKRERANQGESTQGVKNSLDDFNTSTRTIPVGTTRRNFSERG
jgi:hypothetical protein